jgi:hypothetical protein
MQLYIRGRVWDVICNGSQVSEDRREHAKNVMSGPICVMVSETLISLGCHSCGRLHGVHANLMFP